MKLGRDERGSDHIASGGKALYGAPLGILMLEAKFPRIPGDMSNAITWPFPRAVTEWCAEQAPNASC